MMTKFVSGALAVATILFMFTASIGSLGAQENSAGDSSATVDSLADSIENSAMTPATQEPPANNNAAAQPAAQEMPADNAASRNPSAGSATAQESFISSSGGGSATKASDASASANDGTYSQEEIQSEVIAFFGSTTKGLADVVAKAFEDYGRPTGFIAGGEGGAAFLVGLRYGEGTLKLKNGQHRTVYWQGPSAGLDLGANFSKVFTLVYGMTSTRQIFQRFPGVDGSVYIVGGASMNYQQSGDIVLAPIRTGVGLRLGANVGYLAYTPNKSINPF